LCSFIGCGTGEAAVLHIRQGNAGSNLAADHIAVACGTLTTRCDGRANS
jgi:hypothetical protein